MNCSVASMSALIALGSKRDASNPSSLVISRINLSVGWAAKPAFPCFCALLISRLLTTAALNRRFFFFFVVVSGSTTFVFLDPSIFFFDSSISRLGSLRLPDPDFVFETPGSPPPPLPPDSASAFFLAAKRDHEGFLEGTSRERAMTDETRRGREDDA